MKFIIILAIISSSCSDISNILSHEPNKSALDSNSGNSCLGSPQSKEILPFIPAACSFPSALKVGGIDRTLDFSGLQKDLYEMVAIHTRDASIQDGAEGSAFPHYARYFPKLKEILDQSGQIYELSEMNTQNPNGTVSSSSSPPKLTTRGWAYLMRDLVTGLQAQGLDIVTEGKIENGKVIRLINEFKPY